MELRPEEVKDVLVSEKDMCKGPGVGAFWFVQGAERIMEGTE